jgi:methyltransferase (TIGR00027 family)
MKERRASQTAEFMALFRALESTRPSTRRLFEDPLAVRFLPFGLRMAAGAARVRVGHSIVCSYIDRRWPGARTSGVARTSLIDEAVNGALKSGIEQVVISGAGFDSRPYRLPAMFKSSVFEVDH